MMSNLNNKLPSHFKDFINELNRHQVEYMLIGDYALGVYGHIRATSDLDIYINGEENADKMVQAYTAYGIPAASIDKNMFLVSKMVGIGELPLRIEILKKLEIDFEYAYKRINTVTVDGIKINVVDSEDLIILKQAAVRDRNNARDIGDLSFLLKLKNKN